MSNAHLNVRDILRSVPAFKAGYITRKEWETRGGERPTNPHSDSPEQAYLWALGMGLADVEVGVESSLFTPEFEAVVAKDVALSNDGCDYMHADVRRRHLARCAELSAICYGFHGRR